MGVWIETWVSVNVCACLYVTPCMGVWIETYRPSLPMPIHRSHPVWVCGLKLFRGLGRLVPFYVTPCMGVWIETSLSTSPH